MSGQKIEDLLRRIRENENKISEKLILMIGTNDILQVNNAVDFVSSNCSFEANKWLGYIFSFQNTDIDKMCFFMVRILLQLIKNGAIRIILMTIPPIPKLNNYGECWKTLKTFNEFIRKQHNGYSINNWRVYLENHHSQKCIKILNFRVAHRNISISRSYCHCSFF